MSLAKCNLPYRYLVILWLWCAPQEIYPKYFADNILWQRSKYPFITLLPYGQFRLSCALIKLVFLIIFMTWNWTRWENSFSWASQYNEVFQDISKCICKHSKPADMQVKLGSFWMSKHWLTRTLPQYRKKDLLWVQLKYPNKFMPSICTGNH